MAPLLRSAARPAHLGERGQVSVTTRLRASEARGPEGARPNPCPFVWRVPAPRGVGILADLFTGGQDLHTQGDQGAAVFLRSHAHERAGLEVLEGSLTCLLLLASIEDGLAGDTVGGALAGGVPHDEAVGADALNGAGVQSTRALEVR